jgi:sulfonate transport system permease protein
VTTALAPGESTRRQGTTKALGVLRRGAVLVASLWLFAGLVGLWYALSNSSTSPYFPPLRVILTRFGQLWLFSDESRGLDPSLVHFAIGYAIAGVAAVGIATVFYALPLAREATSPVVYFLYVLPAPVLIPAALALFGVGPTMSTAIIAFACFWPILLNATDGLRGTDPLKLETARTLGLPYRRVLRSVVLPGASPQIVAGLRAGLQVGIILMVVSEEVGATNGIGNFIIQAQNAFAFTDMWTGIVVLAVVGTALNVIFVGLERLALRWYYGARAVARSR